MTGLEWRIAALCEQLADGELSRILDPDGQGILARVLDAVRAGNLSKVTVADLDGLDDIAAKRGIDGLTGVRSLDQLGITTRLPGIGHGVPDFAWTCPQHACTRVELGVQDVIPTCAISSRPLDRRIQPG